MIEALCLIVPAYIAMMISKHGPARLKKIIDKICEE